MKPGVSIAVGVLLLACLQRAAILDRDPRGGGMAFLFATELAGLK